MANEIISRNDAKAQGLKRFFTGVPCKCGHVSQRNVTGGCCVECANSFHVKWYELNRDRKLASNKLYVDPKKNRAYSLKWRNKNLEKARANAAKWYANPENSAANRHRRRKDYARNPEKYLAMWRKRHARLKGSAGSHTAADLAEILKLQSGKCAYCRARLSKRKKHADHILPLSCGGSNDRTNIQYLCAPCNLTKGAKDPILFAQELGRLL